MACCGKRREQLYQQTRSTTQRQRSIAQPEEKIVVMFEYVGRSTLTVGGLVSGKQYTFKETGDIVEVDPRDRHMLLAMPSLRQL